MRTIAKGELVKYLHFLLKIECTIFCKFLKAFLSKFNLAFVPFPDFELNVDQKTFVRFSYQQKTQCHKTNI